MDFLFVAGLVLAIVWVAARGGTGLTILLFAGITGSVLFKMAGGNSGWLVFAFILGTIQVVRWLWPKRGQPKAKAMRIAGYQPLNAVGAVEVVGESFYQDALSRIAGGKTEGGHELEVLAGLLPDPTNQYDPNAVGVWVNGLKVGHLSREDASRYSVALAPLTVKGIIGTCPAVIVGGWDRGRGDAGHFGVKLKLGPPEYVLDADVTPPDNALPLYLRDLREATTPKGRRRVLERAIQSGLRDDSSAALMLEASKLEVETALEKAAKLKTPQAKRRVLEIALADLKADEVPDDLQAQQVAWLELALAEIDAPRPEDRQRIEPTAT